jgi:predicted HTH transcriptional regulator
MAIFSQQIDTLLESVKHAPSEQYESDEVEFKEYSSEQSLHNAKDLADEISALANYKGGIIVVGVRDSGNVAKMEWSSQLVGFAQVDLHTTRERLLGKLRPKIDLELRNHSFEGRSYLIISVPNSLGSLVSTSSGRVCIRDGKSSRPMEPDEITNSVKSLQDYDWSAQILDLRTNDALDNDAVAEAFSDFCIRRNASGASLNDFYEAVGVTINGLLTKAGLIFLGSPEAIRTNLGNYEYRFSRRSRRGELLVNDIWDECLWKTIRRAKAHFNAVNTKTKLKARGKEHQLQLLDEIAFHEAFLNALVHRDYSMDGMVSVNFLDETLSIASPGRFYGGVSAENIWRHEPRHRNKTLARMMMEYHLVDRAGMGVQRISLNSLKYGREMPIFSDSSGSVTVNMQAKFSRPGIFVLSDIYSSECGISEYVIMNLLYKIGYASVSSVLLSLSRIEDDPWLAAKRATNNLPFVELSGDQTGVYVRIQPSWNNLFEVQKSYRVSRSSDKYVALYNFLREHGSGSNADISGLLGYAHSSQTSRFLRDTLWVRRSGNGPSAVWSLAG